MKSDIWTLLGIAPTSDRKTIRSAYAAQSRLHHPEEEPEYFVRLNQAYRQALDLARRGGTGDGASGNGEERKPESVVEPNDFIEDKKIVIRQKPSDDKNGSAEDGKDRGKQEAIT